MKRENRVRKNKEFKEIIAKHQSLSSKEFIVYKSPNNVGLTRIGLSVSKKLGNAISRNKIKRQIRAMINTIMKLDKNIDIVIIVRDSYKLNTYIENQKILERLLKGSQ